MPMKARYVGHPNANGVVADEVAHHGVIFPRDEWVGVSDAIAEKLAAKANPAFEVAKGSAPPAAAARPPEAAPPVTAEVSVEELLERLAKYPKAEYDANGSAAELKAALEAAEFEFGED